MDADRSYVHATPSLEDRRLEAWVNVAGHYTCNDYRRTIRDRDVSLLAYCVEGTGGMHLGEAEHRFGPGDLFLQPPYMTHTTYGDLAHPWDVWWLMIGGGYSRTLLELIGLTPAQPLLHVGVHEGLASSFATIYEHLSHQGVTSHLDASQALIGLLLDLVRRRRELDLGGLGPFAHIDYRAESIEQLAKASGYSKYHFIRLFKRATGMTPWHYVLRLKIDKAKDLLLESGRSVKEVAGLVGMDNPLYFSRLFRKMTGMSPTQFRAEGGA